ncbi:family 1 glycosylhydrolase, partial [Bacillus thuringiensis]
MNRFLLDGTLLGFYSDRTRHLIKEILVANNAELHILPEDLEILKQASKQNDMLGINYYQNQTVASYD